MDKTPGAGSEEKGSEPDVGKTRETNKNDRTNKNMNSNEEENKVGGYTAESEISTEAFS